MKEDEIITEYFVDKLQSFQEEYRKLQIAYECLVSLYENQRNEIQKWKEDYECCSLDLLTTRQELDNANRAGYRNKHESQQDSSGKNN